MRTNPEIRKAAYQVCARAVAGVKLTERERQALPACAYIVLDDSRKSRTSREKKIQLFTGLAWFLGALVRSIERHNAKET